MSAARVSAEGSLLQTAIPISTATGHQSYPAVAAQSGASPFYLVVWQDQRSDTGDIYGARVSQAGALLDPAGIAISAASHGQMYPAVAFDGVNFVVSGSGTLRAKVFPVKMTPQGGSGVLRVDSNNNGCKANKHKGCLRFPENTVGLIKFYLPGSAKRAKTCNGQSKAKAVITKIEISVTPDLGDPNKGNFDPANLPLPEWVEAEAFPLVVLDEGHVYKKDVNTGSSQVWVLNTNTNDPAGGPRVFWYRVTAESCKASPPGPWTTDPRGENDGTIG